MLPKEVISRLHTGDGEPLFLMEAPDCGHYEPLPKHAARPRQVKKPIWIDERDALALHDRLLALHSSTLPLHMRLALCAIIRLWTAISLPALLLEFYSSNSMAVASQRMRKTQRMPCWHWRRGKSTRLAIALFFATMCRRKRHSAEPPPHLACY